MVELTVARSELILGGQKSGKSRRAELLAQTWLAQSAAHRAVLPDRPDLIAGHRHRAAISEDHIIEVERSGTTGILRGERGLHA